VVAASFDDPKLQRVQALTAEERELQRHITTVLNTYAPHLLQRHGIGPDSASALLVTPATTGTG
jgi:hypothetical protein